jgi:hypothetical protein
MGFSVATYYSQNGVLYRRFLQLSTFLSVGAHIYCINYRGEWDLTLESHNRVLQLWAVILGQPVVAI